MFLVDWFALRRGHGFPLRLLLWAGSSFLPVVALEVSIQSQQKELLWLEAANGVLQDRIASIPRQSLQSSPSMQENVSNSLTASPLVSQAAQQLVVVAVKHSLAVTEVEYLQIVEGKNGSRYYLVSLPIQGNYKSLKALLAEIKGIPGLSIIGLSFMRVQVADSQLRAQLQFRLYATE